MNLARRIYRIVSSVLVGAIMVLAVLLVGVRLVGLTPYTVISGSMEPTYPVGSLLYVQKVDPTTLQEGDSVTYYMSGGQVVTHRIIEVVEDPAVGVCYRTKGDANNIADSSLLKYTQVIGRPVMAVPLLGYVSWFIQNPPRHLYRRCGGADAVEFRLAHRRAFSEQGRGTAVVLFGGGVIAAFQKHTKTKKDTLTGVLF